MRRGRGFQVKKIDGAGPEYQRRNLFNDADSLFKDKSGSINAHVSITDVGKDGRICEISIWKSTSVGATRDYEKAIKLLLKGLFIAKATIHFVGQSLDHQTTRLETPLAIAFNFPIMHPKYPATKTLLGLIRELEALEDQTRTVPQHHTEIKFTLPRSISLDHFFGEVLNPTGEFRID